jgi:hypothetical protein
MEPMNELDTPDLCARLDTMKKLCDQLEEAQEDQPRYVALVERIRAEANALRDTVCTLPVKGAD